MVVFLHIYIPWFTYNWQVSGLRLTKICIKQASEDRNDYSMKHFFYKIWVNLPVMKAKDWEKLSLCVVLAGVMKLPPNKIINSWPLSFIAIAVAPFSERAVISNRQTFKLCTGHEANANPLHKFKSKQCTW